MFDASTVALAAKLTAHAEYRVTDTVSPSAGLVGRFTVPIQLKSWVEKWTLLPVT